MFKLAFADFDRHPFGRPITPRTFWRLDLMVLLFFALLLLYLLLATTPARAAQCNTYFLTDRVGQLSFPLCPPDHSPPGPGVMDNMAIGNSVPAPGNFTAITVQQGTPATLNATGTLTAAQLGAGIITSTAASAVAATLPLGTAMDAANPNAVATTSIDFFVIDTGSTAAVTMTTNTGWTLVGSMGVALSTSGHFRATKTGVGTWTLYRLT